MAETTTRLGLPLLAAGQAMKHVTVNEALAALDGMIQLAVEAVEVTTPPDAPEAGAIWGIGAGATGAWAGRDGQLAVWTAGGWRFAVPAEGWMAWTRDGGALLLHNGSGWGGYVPGVAALQNMTHVGVMTTADETNRLAAASEAVLFTHAAGGGDARVKVNKAAPGDTASHLFQSGFSGRAEFGLTGDDDFRVKVSPDGAIWHEALVVDRTSGMVRLPGGLDDTFHDLDVSALSSGVLAVPAYGRHFRLTGHGAAHFTISGFGNLRPPGKGFTLLVPRTIGLTGGTANALGNRVRLIHTASGPGLDLTMNRRMVSGSPVMTYDAYPDATDALGAAAALFEALWFVPEGGGRHRLVRLPEPAAIGQNSLGIWKREANGHQVCTSILSIAEETEWSFPARFLDAEVSIQATAGVSNVGAGARIVSKHNGSVGAASVQLSRLNSMTGAVASFAGNGVQATGFWK